MKRSIFDGAIKGENAFTELLKNFLRFKNFRDLILKLIGVEEDFTLFTESSINTQRFLGINGRPDLHMQTENCEIIIEVKIGNSERTINQPEGYYNYLKNCQVKFKHLIFLTPSSYYDLNPYNTKLKEISKKDHNIKTANIHWEQISDVIIANELNLLSPLFAEINIFFDNSFDINKISFTNTAINMLYNKEIPIAIQNLQTIIWKTYLYFEKLGYDIFWSAPKEFTEYGFYFTVQTKNPDDEVFFGLWFENWTDSGNPLCWCIKTDDLQLQKKFENNCYNAEMPKTKVYKQFKISYFESNVLQNDNVIKTLTDMIEKLIEDLNVKQKKLK